MLRMASQSHQLRVNMYYTYIIESIESSSKHYIGYSSDLRQRLLDHNAGKCPSTARYRPWKLIQYTAFESVERALAFEKYLKGSLDGGRMAGPLNIHN